MTICTLLTNTSSKQRRWAPLSGFMTLLYHVPKKEERRKLAKHRTLEHVSYVVDGKVVSVQADRVVDLTDAQATALAGKVALIEKQESMFPDGNVFIETHIVRATVPTFETVAEPPPPPKKSK